MSSSHLLRQPVVVVGVVLVAVVAAWIAVGVRGPSGPSAPLPGASASARTVARAFLDAAVRRDCRALRALSSPDDTDWCPATQWQRWIGEGDPTMHSWHALRSVPDSVDGDRCFEYELDQDGLVGMADGAGTWGLCLHHEPDGWRVAGEGVG